MADNRIEALKQALKMEEDGRSYYRMALDKVEHKMAKWVFDSLIKAEETHISKINQLYNSLKENEKWPDVALTRAKAEQGKNIFESALAELNEKVKGSTNDIDALRHAVDLEHAGQKYYQSRAEKTDDPFEKKFYSLLANEEGEHLVSLLDTIEYLDDPQGYFSQMERGTITF